MSGSSELEVPTETDPAPWTVCVVSSFLPGSPADPCRQSSNGTAWMRGFFRGLYRAGLAPDAVRLTYATLPTPDCEVERADIPDLDRTALLVCPGTDALIRVAAIVEDRPILYFGAHPDNHGVELTGRSNIGGIRLNLPVMWSYDEFARLSQLWPPLRRVCLPRFEACAFTSPQARALYRSWRLRGGRGWIRGDDPHLACRANLHLAERLGVAYEEGPYLDAGELSTMLEREWGRGDLLLAFNDSLLCAGARDLLLGLARRRGVPLVWVNNDAMVRLGAVADWSSDFVRVGVLLGETAAGVLRGERRVSEVGLLPDPGARRILNARWRRELLDSDAAPAVDGFEATEG